MIFTQTLDNNKFKLLEILQGVMDATKTKAQTMAIRNKWIARQQSSNYVNEFDRLTGEMSHLPPSLQKGAVHSMMDDYKLDAIGEVREPAIPAPLAAAPKKAAGPSVPAAAAGRKAKFKYEERISKKTGKPYKARVGVN